MKSFRAYLVWALLAAVAAYNLKADNMAKIQFDLGQNIHDTAKRSGAPKFATRNVAGLMSYKLMDLPEDIPASYRRTGYQIDAVPLFSFMMYADTENDNNLAVEAVSLQFSTAKIRSHESAKAFVESVLEQFQRGQWKRYITEFCPAVTGRSSFLDETGARAQVWSCPLDPGYRMSMDDWVAMMRMTQDYQWVGDGVLATLTVRFSDDVRGITYSIQLEFEDFEIKKRREEARSLADLAEGDAAGRNSTVKRAKEIIAIRLKIKNLEEQAVKRGDTVLMR